MGFARITPRDVNGGIGIPNGAHYVNGLRFAGYSEAAIASCHVTGPTLNVQIARDTTLATPAAANDLAVYVDGVFLTSIRPTVNVIAWSAVAIGAGSHRVDVVTAQQTRPGAVGSSILGAWVTALQGPDLVVIKDAPTRRLIIYGDSLVQACGTNQGVNDLVARTRARYPGGVSVEAFGFRAMSDDASDAVFTARLVAHAGSATAVDLAYLIGTNDFGLTTQSPASLQAQMAARLSASKAALGARLTRIYCYTIPTRGDEATKGLGDCPSYRAAQIAAIATAVGAGVPITTIDGTGLGLNVNTDYNEAAATALHFNDLGTPKVAQGLFTAMGI